MARLKGEATVSLHGEASLTVTRGAESWQFFAFVFAAVLTFLFGMIDLIEGWPDWKIALKPLASLIIGYATLVNPQSRNRLVGLLNRFKVKR
jgi:hypothetical protein